MYFNTTKTWIYAVYQVVFNEILKLFAKKSNFTFSLKKTERRKKLRKKNSAKIISIHCYPANWFVLSVVLEINKYSIIKLIHLIKSLMSQQPKLLITWISILFTDCILYCKSRGKKSVLAPIQHSWKQIRIDVEKF